MAAPAGWYPDPRDPAQDRYWDGEQWTEQTRRRQSEGFVKAYRRLPTWAQWGIPIFAVLLIIGMTTGEEGADKDTSSGQQIEQVDRLQEKLERQQVQVRAERQRARLAIRAKKLAQARARRARATAAAEAETEVQAIEEPVEETGSECDPNYSGCAPPYPPDLDCGEISGVSSGVQLGPSRPRCRRRWPRLRVSYRQRSERTTISK
ncbi:MAG TPA: DUF2510 domain-containing protein [Solirubrobacterales bacterium]